MSNEISLDEIGESRVLRNSKNQNCPMVYFSPEGRFMSMNKAADQLANANYVQIGVNEKFIVFTPVPTGIANTYRLTRKATHAGCYTASAVRLTERCPDLKGRHFRIYRVAGTDKFCLKRGEGLEDNDASI